MKVILIITLVSLVAGLYFFRQKGNSKSEYELSEITQDLESGAILVDVRTPEEFQEEHALGAVNQPLQALQKGDFGNLPKDQRLYVYCRSGNRSAQAAEILKENGYKDIVDIESLNNWKALGGATK